MGLIELLDYACAVLQEAGYPNPWAWSPRVIIHRLDVHNRITAQRRLIDMHVSLLAARGDQKHVERFAEAQKRIAEPEKATPTDTRAVSAEIKPASRRQVEEMQAALAAAGWSM